MSSRARSKRVKNPSQKARDMAENQTRSRGRKNSRQAPYPVNEVDNDLARQEILDTDSQLSDHPAADIHHTYTAQPQPQAPAMVEVLGQVLDRLTRLEQAAVPGPSMPRHVSGKNPDIPDLGNDPETSSQDFEYESLARPIQTYGTLVGQDVSKKLASDIRADKFVEFWELLPNPNRDRHSQFCFEATSSSDLTIVKKRQKRYISFNQWLKAYDIYISIYVEKENVPSSLVLLIKDMLTYRREVTAVHDAGGDWFNFDQHFRLDRAVNPCRFSTVRHDLLRQYEHPRKQQPFRADDWKSYGDFKKSTNFNRKNATSSVPLGYCRMYHTGGARCETKNCRYKHVCPKCAGAHPVYTRCHPDAAVSTGRPAQQAARSNQPNRSAQHRPAQNLPTLP